MTSFIVQKVKLVFESYLFIVTFNLFHLISGITVILPQMWSGNTKFTGYTYIV